MKKFSFELQDVLEYRSYEQEQAEAELGKALAVENEINQNLELLAQQLVNAKEQSKNSRDVQDFIAFSQFSKLVDFQKEELLKQLAQAKIVTEEKRQILMECMKKTSALEKLKEKQLEEYNQAVKKQNKKLIDELGNQGYFRNTFGSGSDSN